MPPKTDIFLSVEEYCNQNNPRGKRADKSSWKNKTLWACGGLLGVVLFVATNTQQVALVTTSAGKTGFITSLYIVFVPLIGLLSGQRPPKIVPFCLIIAVAGFWELSAAQSLTVSTGDLLILACAIAYALQIIFINEYGARCDSMKLCFLQFLAAGILSLTLLPLGELPTIKNVLACWLPLLYVGVMSSSVAYTFQIIGQKLTPPALSSLLMSLESVFSLLGGYVILGEVSTLNEQIGCILVFIAVVFAQMTVNPRYLTRPKLPKRQKLKTA